MSSSSGWYPLAAACCCMHVVGSARCRVDVLGPTGGKRRFAGRGCASGRKPEKEMGGAAAHCGIRLQHVVDQLAQAAVGDMSRRERESAARTVWVAAHDHAPQHDAHGVNVGWVRYLARGILREAQRPAVCANVFAQHLRRLEQRRAPRRSRQHAARRREARQPEVADLRYEPLHDEDVLGLDVVVHDAVPLELQQRLQQLLGQVPQRGIRKACTGHEKLRQRAPAAVLQQQPHVFAVVAHPMRVKPHDVAVRRQLHHRLHLLHRLVHAGLPQVDLLQRKQRAV